MSRPTIGYGQETLTLKKTVVFRPTVTTDTLKGGQLVCYNYDSVKDWEENTKTVNRFSNAEVAFAEGAQDFTARYLEVEKPASGNLNHFAGIVDPEYDGAVNGDIVEVAIPVEGAVAAVYTDLSVTNGATILAVNSGSYSATNPLYGGSSTPSKVIGIALETIDRSSTNGLVWMRFHSGIRFGEGVTTNGYTTGVGVTTELSVIPCSIAIKTEQTDGDFSAIRIRGELAGAGGSAYLGAAIRAEGVVNANTDVKTGLTDAVCAVASHLIFKTGCTPAAGIYSGLWVNAENIDSTPADLAAIDIFAMHVTINNNDAPSLSAMMKFDSKGSDDPDYFIVFEDTGACSGVVSVTDAPALATGDIMVKVKVSTGTGSGDWYIPLMADSGQ